MYFMNLKNLIPYYFFDFVRSESAEKLVKALLHFLRTSESWRIKLSHYAAMTLNSNLNKQQLKLVLESISVQSFSFIYCNRTWG